jgi:hypothetical protein
MANKRKHDPDICGHSEHDCHCSLYWDGYAAGREAREEEIVAEFTRQADILEQQGRLLGCPWAKLDRYAASQIRCLAGGVTADAIEKGEDDV